MEVGFVQSVPVWVAVQMYHCYSLTFDNHHYHQVNHVVAVVEAFVQVVLLFLNFHGYCGKHSGIVLVLRVPRFDQSQLIHPLLDPMKALDPVLRFVSDQPSLWLHPKISMNLNRATWGFQIFYRLFDRVG